MSAPTFRELATLDVALAVAIADEMECPAPDKNTVQRMVSRRIAVKQRMAEIEADLLKPVL